MVKSFATNLFTPWIKTEIDVTNEGVKVSEPNIILGVLPAGKRVHQIPARNISDAVINTSYNVKSIFTGCVLLMIGMYVLTGVRDINSFFIFLLFSCGGLVKVFNGIETTLQILRGGSDFFLSVPFYAKKDMIELQGAVRETLIYGEQKYDLNLFAKKLIEGFGGRFPSSEGETLPRV